MPALKRTAAAVPTVLRDLLSLGGAASVSYGAWLVYAPAGFIVAGLFAFAVGVVGSVRAGHGG